MKRPKTCDLGMTCGALVASLVGLLLWGCSPHDEIAAKFRKGESSSSARDILIPDQVIGRIKKEFIQSYRVQFPERTKTDFEILKDLKMNFVGLHVRFQGRGSPALESDTEFSLPQGGGVIDFFHFVKGLTGSFFLQMTPSDAKLDLKNFKAYFIPNSSDRIIDDEIFGLGCGRVAEVTKAFQRDILSEGFRLNATSARHVPVLLGTLLIYSVGGETLSVAAVEFKDSRVTRGLCRGDYRPGLEG